MEVVWLVLFAAGVFCLLGVLGDILRQLGRIADALERDGRIEVSGSRENVGVRETLGDVARRRAREMGAE